MHHPSSTTTTTTTATSPSITTASSPWPIPVAVYDEDYRGGTFRLSHVVTRYTQPFHWPTTLTLDSTSSRHTWSPTLLSAPLVILRPFSMRRRFDDAWSRSLSASHNLHTSLRHHPLPKQARRQRVIAANGDEWEEAEEEKEDRQEDTEKEDTPTKNQNKFQGHRNRNHAAVIRQHPPILHHIERETGNTMLHFYSPLVTYVLHSATGRLHIDGVCWVLSDMACMPEHISRGAIERMKELRANSIRKQARDHRVVIDLGNRSTTFLAESWSLRDSLRADI